METKLKQSKMTQYLILLKYIYNDIEVTWTWWLKNSEILKTWLETANFH